MILPIQLQIRVFNVDEYVTSDIKAKSYTGRKDKKQILINNEF